MTIPATFRQSHHSALTACPLLDRRPAEAILALSQILRPAECHGIKAIRYAALYHKWPASEGAFLPEHRDALARWFTALSPGNKNVTAVAWAAFDREDYAQALKVAAGLPAVPFCPLP